MFLSFFGFVLDFVSDVASVTGAPEMLGGRVKTLHPAVHAGKNVLSPIVEFDLWNKFKKLFVEDKWLMLSKAFVYVPGILFKSNACLFFIIFIGN